MIRKLPARKNMNPNLQVAPMEPRHVLLIGGPQNTGRDWTGKLLLAGVASIEWWGFDDPRIRSAGIPPQVTAVVVIIDGIPSHLRAPLRNRLAKWNEGATGRVWCPVTHQWAQARHHLLQMDVIPETPPERQPEPVPLTSKPFAAALAPKPEPRPSPKGAPLEQLARIRSLGVAAKAAKRQIWIDKARAILEADPMISTIDLHEKLAAPPNAGPSVPVLSALRKDVWRAKGITRTRMYRAEVATRRGFRSAKPKAVPPPAPVAAPAPAEPLRPPEGSAITMRVPKNIREALDLMRSDLVRENVAEIRVRVLDDGRLSVSITPKVLTVSEEVL